VERSRTKKLAVVVAVLIWSVVTPLMWRDLRRRGPEQVRGPKWLWWIASANLSGSVAYWLFGRTA
jgi:hypothetical protein